MAKEGDALRTTFSGLVAALRDEVAATVSGTFGGGAGGGGSGGDGGRARRT